MDHAGDAYVYFKSSVTHRDKYYICTLDTSTPYIKEKLHNNLKAPVGSIKVFCWDSNSFKILEVSKVTKIIPLSTIVKQSPDMVV
jgi:hypothetical protein